MKKSIFVLALLLMGVAVFAGCSRGNNNEPEPVDPADPPVIEEPGIFTVEKVDPVIAVINNHTAARPQSGLQHASIVYEFLAEAGYTRLLAVFDTPMAEDVTVGPVRSLRPYFAVQAMEHGGVVAHSGYSQRTRSMISGLGLREIVSSTYLYRDNSRKAPHNLYSSTNRLYQARGESQVTSEQVPLPELPQGYAEGLEIKIEYASHNHVRWAYDSTNKVYLRFVDGVANTDRETQKQYSARRVIVRRDKVTNVPGESLVNIDLSGSGTGQLYEEGRLYEITWEKSSGVTGYYYQDGTPLDLRLGNTWIQSVRQ